MSDLADDFEALAGLVDKLIAIHSLVVMDTAEDRLRHDTTVALMRANLALIRDRRNQAKPEARGESFQQAARDLADIKQDGEPEPVADMTFRAVPRSTKRYRLTPEPVPDCEAHGLPTPCVVCNS